MKTIHFSGNRDDQVRQVGNSWGVGIGEALCREALKKIARGAA